MTIEESRPIPAAPARTLFGVHPLKIVFALEYVLQGLANPFQGLTYQPFFRHFRFDYGLSEAATQGLFAKSYLAWSFKPVLGFFIDAYGRTRTLLVALLGAAALGYLLAPIVDRGPLLFFGFMFALSIVLAATDVSVDRATVIAGEEEANETGRSKSTTVGLNQAICWASIYGTSIVAAVLGGYFADNVSLHLLLLGLALVPATVLVVALMLPRDRAVPIPLSRSIRGFWAGLNSGPILSVMAFFFIFHFQPAMGALWNNYLIETLRFSQTQIGVSDGAGYAGLFLGVLLFAWKGVRWQERLGLRTMFRIYIVASIAIGLTQYLLVEPWFSRITGTLARLFPFVSVETLRMAHLCTYNAVLAVGLSLIRMGTFSLVGAVVPVAAAGSLFAGFMSVNNLAYSMSYASGAWLYEHGLEFGFLRAVQEELFAEPAARGGELSVKMLILINALAYLVSFAAVHVLPDRRQTLATGADEAAYPGPERWNVLDARLRRAVDVGALVLAAALFLGGRWMLALIVGYADSLFRSIPSLIG